MALRLKGNRRYPTTPVVTDDPQNHTQVLMAMKESLEIGQRRTSDILNSFVRVEDLVDLGIITIQGGVNAIFEADLSQIADIGDLTGSAEGDFLRFRSGVWVNDQLENADITQVMVTQHEAALSIDWSQLTSIPSPITAYAGGDVPSAFTLGIVDSVDAAAWRTAIGAGTVSGAAGSTREVQFNNAGAFGASANFTYSATGNLALGAASVGNTLLVNQSVAAPGISLVGSNNFATFMGVGNTNAGTAALAFFDASNGTDIFYMGMTGTGYTGPHLTGGPAGTIGVLATDTAKSLAIGTNQIARLSFDGSTGVATFYQQIIGRYDAIYSSTVSGALSLKTSTNTAKHLWMGFDGSQNVGFIQATEDSVAHRPLWLNPNGGTVVTPASVTGASGFNLPHGTAPSSPVNGDLWTTTAGAFVRINGATVGPLGSGGSTGANPSASIGLTAVNGAATTFLRSDGAPALSQAIAPTWTELHTFSNVSTSSLDGTILLSSTIPILGFREGGATTDQKVWDIVTFQSSIRVRTGDDSGGANKDALRFNRTGTALTTMVYGNTTDLPLHTFNGQVDHPYHTEFTKLATTSYDGQATFRGAYILNGYFETDQATDKGGWDMAVNAGVFAIRSSNDAGSTQRNWLSATRGTGIAIASMAYGNSTDYSPHTFYGTGTFEHSADAVLSLTAPSTNQINLYTSGGASDAKRGRINNGTGGVAFSFINDAYSLEKFYLVVARTGYATTSMAYGNSTDLPTHLFNSAAIGSETFTFAANADGRIVTRWRNTANNYSYHQYEVNSGANGYIGDGTAMTSGGTLTDFGIAAVNNLILGAGNGASGVFLMVQANGTTVAAPATTARASLRMAHGAAPSAPVDGDVWTTTAGLFVRINGATVGPLT